MSCKDHPASANSTTNGAGDPLDEALEESFPASDPPAVTISPPHKSSGPSIGAGAEGQVGGVGDPRKTHKRSGA